MNSPIDAARELAPVPDAPSPPPPTRTLVRRAVERAWASAVAVGALPDLPDGVPVPEIEISRPDESHGDYATNLAFRLARPLRRSPVQIAEAIASALGGAERDAEPGAAAAAGASPDGVSPIGGVEVAAPGFINIRLSPAYVEAAVDAARQAAERYGTVATDRPRRFNVEFVSANPTGPLHIGNARGAFVGDLLCRVLEGAGHEVTREYYFNDFGAQIRNLGASVAAFRAGTEIPEDGYRGDYVRDLARELPDETWKRATADGSDTAWIVGLWAQERVRSGIEASLAHLGVHFDVWKSESSLYDEGWVGRSIEELRSRGNVYEKDGATWFGSTAFGDDKDRVLRKSNGDYTYFASDVGYVSEKFSRGFDHLVYIWGADHHGTVARVKNAAQALGRDRDALEMLLIAWVRFIRDGVEVSMSKRAGEFITLDELLAEIGVDAARWFFAARGHTSGIDFDIELAKKQSNENPVYYVQYAHARISSILRKATETGLAPSDSVGGSLADDPAALGLAKLLLQLPEVVEDAAEAHETQGVTAYATELATVFHAFYRDRRVVDAADPRTSGRRLALVSATRQGLANTLTLLGISAPDSM
jgi:arginyl-tRNA synthetase